MSAGRCGHDATIAVDGDGLRPRCAEIDAEQVHRVSVSAGGIGRV
jgi:hypothetical protein